MKRIWNFLLVAFMYTICPLVLIYAVIRYGVPDLWKSFKKGWNEGK